MSRILIVVNTYYQLIFAIQMRLTVLKGDKVDIVVSDHSRNAEDICKRLAKEELFDHSFFVETRALSNGVKKVEKLTGILSALFGNKIYDFINKTYDLLLLYYFDLASCALWLRLHNLNPEIKCSRFEEGILSYNATSYSKRTELVNKIMKVMGRREYPALFQDFYCFYPQLYNGHLNCIQVPPISVDLRVSDILKRVFRVEAGKNAYPEKYIFFTSILDIEGESPIDEYGVVCKVAEMVGRENLLVKTHPRDYRGLYEKKGFHIDSYSAIPWEVIQLSQDFSDKVFLTTTSGSVLAGSFLAPNPIKTFFLYPLCNIEANSIARRNVENINALIDNIHRLGISNDVCVVSEIADIYN